MPSKAGNIYLDFKNSLLKYAPNNRRYKFVINRITVDMPVKEKIKAMNYKMFFYYNLANNLHWRSALDRLHGAIIRL